MRHDKVCAHLHYSICKALGTEIKQTNGTHTPKQVYEQEDVTVLWYQAAHTDTEVTANRLDIITKNKKEETCTLVDVAMPADKNVKQSKREKRLKYKSLCIEIQRMWNMKCMIIPVITGDTGTVTKGFKEKIWKPHQQNIQ
jgi:hypothetical protein